MRRERNSLFALPVDQYFDGVNEKHPNVNDKLTSYSNLILATPGQVVQGIISKERFEMFTNITFRFKLQSIVWVLFIKFNTNYNPQFFASQIQIHIPIPNKYLA